MVRVRETWKWSYYILYTPIICTSLKFSRSPQSSKNMDNFSSQRNSFFLPEWEPILTCSDFQFPISMEFRAAHLFVQSLIGLSYLLIPSFCGNVHSDTIYISIAKQIFYCYKIIFADRDAKSIIASFCHVKGHILRCSCWINLICSWVRPFVVWENMTWKLRVLTQGFSVPLSPAALILYPSLYCIPPYTVVPFFEIAIPITSILNTKSHEMQFHH